MPTDPKPYRLAMALARGNMGQLDLQTARPHRLLKFTPNWWEQILRSMRMYLSGVHGRSTKPDNSRRGRRKAPPGVQPPANVDRKIK